MRELLVHPCEQRHRIRRLPRRDGGDGSLPVARDDRHRIALVGEFDVTVRLDQTADADRAALRQGVHLLPFCLAYLDG